MGNLLLKLFSHRLLAIGRWDVHFILLRLRNRLKGQNGKIATFMKTRQAPSLLNLGSGPRGLNDRHWTNVDGFADKNVHFLIDFQRPLPFADNCFDGVFCEHVVEHFTYDGGQALAREVLRVLKPGGCFRVIVPDAEFVMRSYFETPKELIAYRGVAGETPMEAVNDFFRQRYEHQFLYDAVTMDKMLRGAGFAEVVRTPFGMGEHLPALVVDDAKYETESLYVEARKG
jgi:predicted SAM-dependent methyltransferase